MRTYEALYIVRPDIEDDQIQTIAKDVENLVTAAGGTIVRSEIWGKRKLAYPVKKCVEGNYILLRFTAQPAFIAKLEAYFKLADSIIRYLTVYFDDRMLRLETEQQLRREEEARQAAANASRRDANNDDDDDDDEDDDYVPRGGNRRRGRRYNDDDDDNEADE